MSPFVFIKPLLSGVGKMFGMNLGSILGAGSIGALLGQSGGLSNWFAKTTGSRLTDAEREANAFTAEREDIAWQRQMEASNTAHQREVADLKAAGINPMMTATGGAGSVVPSASASGSVSPSGSAMNLGSLITDMLALSLEAKKLPAEIANINADTRKKSADTSKATEDTRGSKLSNDFFEMMKDVRAESERLERDLKTAQKRQIWKSIDVMESEIIKNIESAHSEQERQALYVQQALLAQTTAENITAMQPYMKAELSARAENERAAAKVAAVDEAYRRELIDAGSIKAAVRLTNAQATDAEASAEVKEVEKFLKDYDAHRKAGDLNQWLTAEESSGMKVIDALYSGVSALTASLLGK